MTDKELKKMFKNPPTGWAYPSKEIIDNSDISKYTMRTNNDTLIKLYNYLFSIGYVMTLSRGEEFSYDNENPLLKDAYIEICAGKKGTDYKLTGYIFTFSSLNNTMEEMFESVLKVIEKDFI